MDFDPKELGAKQMFDQSIVYLYNSYREQGMTREQASRLATDHIEDIYRKYASMNLLEKERDAIRNPKRWIEDVVSDIHSFDWDSWRTLTPKQREAAIHSLLGTATKKLNRLKTLLD